MPWQSILAVLCTGLVQPAQSAIVYSVLTRLPLVSGPLQTEYLKLQALYEDLKAAKIDEEVQQLLEQQNRHVTEHGQKAAQLVEHCKAEVGAWFGGCVAVGNCMWRMCACIDGKG